MKNNRILYRFATSGIFSANKEDLVPYNFDEDDEEGGGGGEGEGDPDDGEGGGEGGKSGGYPAPPGEKGGGGGGGGKSGGYPAPPGEKGGKGGEGVPNPHSDHEDWELSDEELDELEGEWENRVNELSKSEHWDDLPANIKTKLGEMLSKKSDSGLDWTKLMSNWLKKSKQDYDMSRFDRRFTDFGLPTDKRLEEVKDIVVAIDTSGSVSGSEMEKFKLEVMKIFDQFQGKKGIKVRGTLLYCDAKVANSVDISNKADVMRSVPMGGGGTDFRPVFNWIDQNIKKCAGLVYLTDAYGSFPSEHNGYPVIWVITGNGHYMVPKNSKYTTTSLERENRQKRKRT